MSAERVLIIDDDPLILTSTRMVLKVGGFEVLTAETATDGLVVARRDLPDLILLDVMLPDLDGWTTLARIQDDAALRRIPVLMFTAREHPRGAAHAREQGAAGYVRKPFEPRELIAEIKRVLLERA